MRLKKKRSTLTLLVNLRLSVTNWKMVQLYETFLPDEQIDVRSR